MPSELYDHELERSAVAAVADASQLELRRGVRLLDQSALTAEDFHLPAHQQLFAAVVALVRSQRPADLLSVQAALPMADRRVLTAVLCGAAVSDHAFAGYAEVLQELALRRRLVAAARDLAARAENRALDVSATVGQAAATIAAVTRRNTTARSLDEVLTEVLAEREEIEAGTGPAILSTGLSALDEAIGGLQPTLTIVGAHPGVGKSAFLAAVIRNLARAGKTVAVFSLEDQASWMVWRYLAAESSVAQFVLRTRPLTEEQHDQVGIGSAAVHAYAPRILVDDRTGLSPGEVVQTARDLIVNRGAQAVFVDHLGELRYESRRADRHDLDMAEGLSDLRGLAKQYGTPVVCATHLRREAADPPRLFDFANAAAIERQARVALALSRAAGAEELAVWVLKHTNGKAGVTVRLPFLASAAMVGEPRRGAPLLREVGRP